MILFIIPKNSGLEKCREIAQREYSGVAQIIVRGEDIPLIVKNLIGSGKKVIGITGEDLFKEFLLNYKNSGLITLRKFKWQDNNALFGRPCLCLLGAKGRRLDDLPRNLKVCINKKYSKIAKKYLSRLEDRGFRFEKLYLSGVTEEAFTKDLVDLVIEIVYSGKSANEAELEIYDKIFESNIVLIGGNDGI